MYFKSTVVKTIRILKERRTKQEIYVDILNSIEIESSGGDVKLTRIQLASKLSYDKVKKHLTVLEKYGLAERKPVIKVTEKGKLFKKISSQALMNVELIKEEYFKNQSFADEDMLIKAQTKNDTKYFLHNEKKDQTTEFNWIQKIKDQQQVQNAMQAIIEELE